MLSRHIALVSETSAIGLSELSTVAAALQKQVVRDFGPIWGITADVAAFPTLEHIPLDYWPIIIQDDLPRPEAAGYHEDDLGEPYALVRLTDDWSVTASHEMLEILADPWGRHMIAGPSPIHPETRVKFLVEVCDPCPDVSYKVNGIAVSDFYTPHFFDPVGSHGVRYSYTGALTAPRQVLKGGYLTWYDPSLRAWWHRCWFDGAHHSDAHIPIPAIVKGNIRATIDRHLAPAAAAAKNRGEPRTLSQGDEPGRASFNRASDIRRTYAPKA